MPSARSVLPQYRKPSNKRKGKPTEPEKALVAQFILDQPAEITTKQVNGLARTLRRTKDTVLKMIEEARDDFQDGAKRYVEVHKQAIEAALANGDAKSLHVAVQGAQWAMENLTAEGVSIIEKKQDTGSKGGKLMIGIQIGGIRKDEAATVIEAEKL